MEKKGKNKTCKNPTLPAWLSVEEMREYALGSKIGE